MENEHNYTVLLHSACITYKAHIIQYIGKRNPC